jgi:CubicO group peptidase (beta-lactamase class C family)
MTTIKGDFEMIIRMMIAVCTLGVVLTFSSLPGVAVLKPNFSGVWVLDKSKSDGLPPDVDQTVTIAHEGDKVEIATRTTSERGEQNSKSSYVLDGKEMEVTLSGPMPGSSVKGKQTSKWSADGNGFESADEGTFETPNGPAVIKTARKFQLAPDGATLIIEISREGPMTMKSKRVFAKSGGAATARQAGHKMSEAEIVKQTETYLDQAVAEDTFSGGALIAKDGKPIFEKAYGLANKRSNTPNNVDTKFNLGSINKSFTSVAIAQLAQQGKLSFNDPIGKYLPDYPNKTIADKVTIHQLLTHTSGMGMYFNDEFMKRRASLKKLADLLPLFVNDRLDFEPGEKMQYSNSGYVVLGLIIEKLTKQNYFDYVREHIFKPAGMKNTDSYELEQKVPNLAIGYTNMGLTGRPESGPRKDNTPHLTGRGSSAGGGYSTLEDMLKFGQALIGHQLLNQKYTDVVLSNQMPPGQPSAGYGFFSVEVNGTRAIGNNGGGPGTNSTFTVYPELGYTVVIMSNYDPPSASTVTSKLREMLTAK